MTEDELNREMRRLGECAARLIEAGTSAAYGTAMGTAVFRIPAAEYEALGRVVATAMIESGWECTREVAPGEPIMLVKPEMKWRRQ